MDRCPRHQARPHQRRPGRLVSHPEYVLGDQLRDRLEELLAESQSDASVQLSFDDRPLKLGAARIEEITRAIAAHPMNQPMQTHLAIASTVQPESTALIEQAARAFKLNAHNA